MRTNIEIDDELLAQAKELGHFKTKKETVEAALVAFIRRRAFEEFDKGRGPGAFWEDYNYKAMRAAD